MSTLLTKEQALDLHSDLYRSDYRDYHSRSIDCLGVDKWLENAEKAVRDGKSPARYFSYLIKQEMAVYNIEKAKYRSQLAS